MGRKYSVSALRLQLIASVAATAMLGIFILANAASASAAYGENFCEKSIPAHEVCHGAFGNVESGFAEAYSNTGVWMNVETFSNGAWHNATGWAVGGGVVSMGPFGPLVYGSPTIYNPSSKTGSFGGFAVYE